MNELKHPQSEFLKSNPLFNSCWFPNSIWFIAEYIFPILTPEQGFYDSNGNIQTFSVNDLLDYIQEDGTLADKDLLEDLKFIGVDNALLIELAEFILRERDLYLDFNVEGWILSAEEKAIKESNVERAKKANNEKYKELREKKQRLFEIWEAGKYKFHTHCAKCEHEKLGLSEDVALKALRQKYPKTAKK